MTVREWVRQCKPPAPPLLLDRLIELLGSDAMLPAQRTATVLIGSAGATLQRLLEEGRFSREGALDLLAVDAMMTYAYEHAGNAGMAAVDLDALAGHGMTSIGHLTDIHG